MFEYNININGFCLSKIIRIIYWEDLYHVFILIFNSAISAMFLCQIFHLTFEKVNQKSANIKFTY